MPPLLFLAGNAIFLARLVFGWSFTLFRVTYAFNTIILPIALCAASWHLLLARHRDRSFPRASALGGAYLVVALLLIGVRIYATHIEPHRLTLRHVRIESPKLRRPVRLLHISDFQTARIGGYEEKVVRMVRELDPDLVIHSGDLLQCRTTRIETEMPKLTRLFSTVTPPMGKYGVYGDTDWRLGDAGTEALGGLVMLKNSSVTLSDAGSTLRILGLSRRTAGERPPSLLPTVSDWLDTAQTNDFCILVGHAPDFVMEVSSLPIDLCLAGHTHGGQVRIPFFGPIMTLSTVPRKLARGFHQVGNTRINVSAGIGVEHAGGMPPLRFNCPPEMTLIELVPLDSHM